MTYKKLSILGLWPPKFWRCPEANYRKLQIGGMGFDYDDDLSSASEGQNTSNKLENDLSPAEEHYLVKPYSKKILFAIDTARMAMRPF
jgi:hypothetical protein